jgi:hypothetical protein
MMVFLRRELRDSTKTFTQKNKWMTSGLLTSRRKKLSLAKNCAQNPTPANIEQYKTYRNIYNGLVRLSRKNYYSEQLQANSKNLKKSWSLINEALNKNKSFKTLDKIIVDTKVISNQTDIANHFNTFYTTIATNLSKEINPVLEDFDCSPITNARFSLTSFPLLFDELTLALNEMQDKKNS